MSKFAANSCMKLSMSSEVIEVVGVFCIVFDKDLPYKRCCVHFSIMNVMSNCSCLVFERVLSGIAGRLRWEGARLLTELQDWSIALKQERITDIIDSVLSDS